MTKSGPILITFAWGMELIGVTGGALNSTYTTFGDDLPVTFAGYIPAVPMVALAAAEFGRVPLASVVYDKHRIMQAVAVLGILALGYLAVENWTFGFERVVDLRLKPVNAAARELALAEAELSRLKDQRDHLAASGGQKRNELRMGISQRDASIAELTAQLGKEGEVHQKNLDGIREACRIIKDRCMVPRSQAEDSRYAAAVKGLGSELERQRDERKQLQSQIDELVSVDAGDAADIGRSIATTVGVVTDARREFRTAVDGRQIYRLLTSRSIATTVGVVTDARREFRTAVDGRQIYRLLTSRYGTKRYAAEELVAELTAAFPCAHLKIKGEPSGPCGAR